jgi:hypothetical protein
LNNPITRVRIENLCGSIETFLADPSILRGHQEIDPNFSWMRAVSPEEARASLERLTNWAKEHPVPKGGSLGEWVYQERKASLESATRNIDSTLPKPAKENIGETRDREPLQTKSLTPNAFSITLIVYNH